jgi:hypothetical protein
MWGIGSREEILEQYNLFSNELYNHAEVIIPIIGSVIESNFLSIEDSIDGCHLNDDIRLKLIKQIKMLIK